jgi:ATPase family associated with various cellular activities (AAA)
VTSRKANQEEAGTEQLSGQPPAWFGEISTLFASRVAHGFILEGDVWGVTMQNIPQRRFLQMVLGSSRGVVAYYNRACGITFALPSIQQRAEQLLSAAGGPSVERDPISAVLDESGAGVVPVGDVFRSARRPQEALPLLDQLLRAPDGRNQVAVILDFADMLCPAQDKAIMSADDRLLLVTLLSWGQDEELSDCGNPIFLLARDANEVHADLRSAGSGYQVVEIPLPTGEERLAYIGWYLKERKRNGRPVALVGLTEAELAALSAGLNLRNVENILLLGARSGGVNRALVKASKDAIIRAEYSDIAEMLDPLPGGFASMGGIERLVAWARAELLDPLSAGSRDLPKDVLLAGPPGTGKTMFVRALAFELGFNCVALRSENILGSLVGQSERQLKRFFAFVRSLAPVLVFFDELDQSGMSRRGNNSGNPVDVNLFSQVLQFTGDESLRGEVLMCFASNRPDLIDDALLRRMDAILPVLLVDEEGRRGIIAAQSRGQRVQVTDALIATMAAQTDRYSADDLRAVVFKAKKVARRQGREGQLEEEDVARALWAITPGTPRIANRYTTYAVRACNDRELLPPPYDTMQWGEADKEDTAGEPLRRSAPGTQDERRL